MARILVIDDERKVAHVIRLLLEARGHEVLVADDGSRGIATAQRQSPEAIILDLMMPVMDGFAVLEALRDDDRTAHIPVMIVSAVQTEPVEQRCYGMGAKSYIRKPFDAAILIGTVEELASSIVDRPRTPVEPEPRGAHTGASFPRQRGTSAASEYDPFSRRDPSG